MGYLLGKRGYWRLLAATLLGLCLFIGHLVYKAEANPHIRWRLSRELGSPEDVLGFLNNEHIHHFSVVKDAREKFYIIYED